MFVSGGLAIGTIVDSRTGSMNGGLQVSSGGTASNTSINSGGFEVIFTSGTDIGTTISGGGVEIVSGGTISNVTVDSGRRA